MGVNNDGTLRYDTKVDLSGFKKGLAEIKKDALKDSGEVLKSFNKTAKAIALSAASIGAGIVAVGVKYNAQMEQYNAGFTTMLGSAEKAQKLMGDLKGFAAKTPFELTDLANASTTLLAFGEDVEQLMPDLKMLGDISLGNAEKFKGLALVFGQVQSQGRLMGQDLLQMINQGFNPLQIISEKTGKSVATLKDEMAKGQISFEMVADAMKAATSEGGQFYNAMEKQSKTLNGQWSTLKDNVVALTGEMASGISEKLTEDVLPKLIKHVETLTQMWEDGRLQDYIGTATAALVTFGTAITALNIILFVNDMAQLTSGVKNYTTATKAGAAAQKLMNAELLKNPYTLVAAALAALVAGIITLEATHKSVTNELLEEVNEVATAHDDAVKAIEKNKEAEIAAAEKAKIYKNELYSLHDELKKGTVTQEEANIVTENFKTVAGKLEELIPGISDALYDETGEINLQREAIDKLCDSYYELMYAKATANAAEELISESAKVLVEQKRIQNEAKTQADKAIAERKGLVKVDYVDADGNVYKERPEGIITFEQIHHDVIEKDEELTEVIEDSNEAWKAAQSEIDAVNKEISGYLAVLKDAETEVSRLTKTEESLGKETKKTANTVVEETTKTTVNRTKAFEEQYKNLKRSLERGEIVHADYYKGLEKLRDTYFKEGSDEWEKYTEELADFTEDTFDDCLDKLDDLKEESLDKIRELKDEQDALTKKLMSDKSPVEFGTVDGEKFAILADYNQENNKLRKYKSMLDELGEARADLPETVYAELAEMDIDQAMKYVEALLNATEHQYNAFLENRALNEELAHQNSSKLLSAEAEGMKRILEEKFGELPEDFFDLGDESATAFGDAFLAELEHVMQTVKATVMAEMSKITNAAVVSFSSGIGGGATSITNNNNYSSSYTFNSSQDTTTAQLQAARDAATIERLRGGN